MFIVRFLEHGNATLAAKEAGFGEKSAHVTGARLLKDPKIQAVISGRMEKAEITSEWILAELKKLAGFDPGKLYDKNGNRLPVHQLDDNTRAAVASVEDETFTSDDGVTRKQRVKMADKVRPLELLGRYRKLFTDRIEHDGRVTLEELVSGGRDGKGSESAHS